MKKLLFKNAAKNAHEEKEKVEVLKTENPETLSGLLIEPFFFGKKCRLLEEGGEPVIDFEVYYGFATGFATMSEVPEAPILAVAIDADGKVLAKRWAGGESREAAQEERKKAKDETYRADPLKRWLRDATTMGLARLCTTSRPGPVLRHSYLYANANSTRKVGTFV